MLVLIVYDVETKTPEGRRRLGKVAKICVNHGQRVQNSVFECLLSEDQFIEVQAKIEHIASRDLDSIRYYNLGNNWKTKIKRFGGEKRNEYNPQGPIIL